MSYRDIVKLIPHSMYKMISEKFMDILLEAKEGGKVPSSLAKTILYYWQRDQLASEAGLNNLLQAVVVADPDKVTSILDEFGLEEVKLAILNVAA